MSQPLPGESGPTPPIDIDLSTFRGASQFYRGLPALQPTLALPAEALEACVQTLATATHPDYCRTGAWASIELAEIHDAQGRPDQASFARQLARELAARGMGRRHKYKNFKNGIEQAHRLEMLHAYVGHLTADTESQVPFWWEVRDIVAAQLVRPHLEQLETLKSQRGEDVRHAIHQRQHIIGELCVVQALNELRRDYPDHSWLALPSNDREKGIDRVSNENNAFNYKMRWADGSFVPLDIRDSSRGTPIEKLNPDIAHIRVDKILFSLGSVILVAANGNTLPGTQSRNLKDLLVAATIDAVKSAGKRAQSFHPKGESAAELLQLRAPYKAREQ